MADYYTVFKSNHFDVTDEKYYKNILRGIVCNDFINKLDLSPQQAFGGYGDAGYYPLASQSETIQELMSEDIEFFDENGDNTPDIADIDYYDKIYDSIGNILWDRFDDDGNLEYLDLFYEALQNVIDDNTKIAIHTISHEKLKDVHSEIVVITKDSIDYNTSQQFIDDLNKKTDK